MAIEWQQTPAELADNINAWGDLVRTNVGLKVADVGIEAQNNMRANRPWQDETGNAKRGLHTQVSQAGEEIVLFFIHGAEYGIHLELGRGGRYAVVWPTLTATIPRLKKALTGAANER